MSASPESAAGDAASAWVGCLSWFDLNTTDLEAARAFYEAVCGWGMELWPAEPPYPMFTSADGKARGGYRELPPGVEAPPHWLTYIATDDVQQVMARCAELGGAVMMDIAVPTVGHFAVMRDPQGAVFAAIQPDTPPVEPEPEGEGTIGWIELSTSDHRAAWGFYQALFGWVASGPPSDMGPMGEYFLFGRREGKSLGGMWTIPEGMPIPPSWLPYVESFDLDAAVGRITEHGGVVVNGPMEVPGGDRIVQFRDPQGGMCALHQPAPGA